MLCNECTHFNVCRFSDDVNRTMELVAKVADTPNPIRLDLRCDAFMPKQMREKQIRERNEISMNVDPGVGW